jgi:predicted transcriptional regulator
VPETKNLLLRLDPELAERLQAIAAVEERSVSDVVREAIAVLVEQRRADRGFQRRLKATARRNQEILRQLGGLR